MTAKGTVGAPTCSKCHDFFFLKNVRFFSEFLEYCQCVSWCHNNVTVCHIETVWGNKVMGWEY
jgi:hypothetical protein